MIQRVKAIYRDGTFVPEESVELPDGAEVNLLVEAHSIIPPPVADPDERHRILNDLVDRMQLRTMMPTAPRPTRDELHERR